MLETRDAMLETRDAMLGTRDAMLETVVAMMETIVAMCETLSCRLGACPLRQCITCVMVCESTSPVEKPL
jgi:hypothetical protein